MTTPGEMTRLYFDTLHSGRAMIEAEIAYRRAKADQEKAEKMKADILLALDKSDKMNEDAIECLKRSSANLQAREDMEVQREAVDKEITVVEETLLRNKRHRNQITRSATILENYLFEEKKRKTKDAAVAEAADFAAGLAEDALLTPA